MYRFSFRRKNVSSDMRPSATRTLSGQSGAIARIESPTCMSTVTASTAVTARAAIGPYGRNRCVTSTATSRSNGRAGCT